VTKLVNPLRLLSNIFSVVRSIAGLFATAPQNFVRETAQHRKLSFDTQEGATMLHSIKSIKWETTRCNSNYDKNNRVILSL